MSKKMKVETPLNQLKKLHGKAMSQVSLLLVESNEIAIKLKEAQNLVAQTADAIDALEGRPSLKQQLEEALKPKFMPASKMEPQTPNAFTAAPTPTAEYLQSLGLPPAEPGFMWQTTPEGEHVLVKDHFVTVETLSANTAIPLTLPAVMDDEEFTDKPQDFLG